jgi:hypothetical protein
MRFNKISRENGGVEIVPDPSLLTNYFVEQHDRVPPVANQPSSQERDQVGNGRHDKSVRTG